VFSLLFRPLFFDAGSMPAFIASFENLILLVLGAVLLTRYKLLIMLSKKVFFVRFALMHSLVLTLMLALTYYNVGLGSRQKAVMITPSLIVLLMVTMGLAEVRRRQRLASQPSLVT
jgi:CDP-diglyceride synthetase